MNKNKLFRIIIFIIYPMIAVLTTIISGILVKSNLTYNITFVFPPNKVECDLFVDIFQIPLSIFIISLILWYLIFIISIKYIPKQTSKQKFLSGEDFDPDDKYDVFSHLNKDQKQHKRELIDDIKVSSSNSLWSTLLTINGLLIAILSILLSFNKKEYSICIIFVSLLSIILILTSSFFILMNYHKIRKQGQLYLLLLDDNLPIKKKKSVEMLTTAINMNDEVAYNEKLSFVMITISFIFLLILFILVY